MEQTGIIPHLQNLFGEDQIQDCPETKDTCVMVAAEKLLEVMSTLKDDPDLRMSFLNSVTGLDMLGLPGVEEPCLRSVYHLYSYEHRHDLVVMVDVDRQDPLIPSMAGLWDSAIWLEREAFDLVGLIYEGHPNLTRVLLPAEFEGHPLRRDWVESEFVMGIETQRDTPVDLLKFFHENMGGEAPPELTTAATSTTAAPALEEPVPEAAPAEAVAEKPAEKEAAPAPAAAKPAAEDSAPAPAIEEDAAAEKESKPSEEGAS